MKGMLTDGRVNIPLNAIDIVYVHDLEATVETRGGAQFNLKFRSQPNIQSFLTALAGRGTDTAFDVEITDRRPV